MDQPLILNISINGLFGIYNYKLPSEGHLKNAAILYGDNGVGKSTVLRLAFHLLSAAHDRGHRNALYAVEFESLSVALSNGYVLQAFQEEQEGSNTPKKMTLTIKKGRKRVALWEFIPKGLRRESEYYVKYDPDGRIYIDDETTNRVYFENTTRGARTRKVVIETGYEEKIYGERIYLRALSSCVPNMFILSADRRLDSDSVPDPSDEMELRRLMRYEEAKRINDLVARSRDIALTQALASAAKWVSKKALQSANKGSENVHSVYSSVLKHLVSHSSTARLTAETIETSLHDRLEEIERKTREFSVYEFATPLSTTEFKRAIATKLGSKRKLAIDLITPYVESLESRLAAVDSIYRVVDKFVKTINSLLVDKRITYRVNQGFSIYNINEHLLEPSSLSSGEQQLLLLFCYVLTGRDKECVFMIDEPEISLNVKWQRKLIQSLLDITSGSDIQFIFASHSMELLSQHRHRVVVLEREHE